MFLAITKIFFCKFPYMRYRVCSVYKLKYTFIRTTVTEIHCYKINSLVNAKTFQRSILNISKTKKIKMCKKYWIESLRKKIHSSAYIILNYYKILWRLVTKMDLGQGAKGVFFFIVAKFLLIILHDFSKFQSIFDFQVEYDSIIFL